MTDQTAMLNRLVHSIQNAKASWHSVCGQLEEAPVSFKHAYRALLPVFGCCVGQSPDTMTEAMSPRSALEREAAAKLLLLKFELQTGDPKWSSWMMERAFSAFLAVPGASIVDVLRALTQIAETIQHSPSASLFSFIRDVAIVYVTQHSSVIDETSLGWLVSAMKTANAPQAYLGLYVIPPSLLRPESVVGILSALRCTDYWEEALTELQDHLRDPLVRPFIVSWIEQSQLTTEQLQNLKRKVGLA